MWSTFHLTEMKRCNCIANMNTHKSVLTKYIFKSSLNILNYYIVSPAILSVQICCKWYIVSFHISAIISIMLPNIRRARFFCDVDAQFGRRASPAPPAAAAGRSSFAGSALAAGGTSSAQLKPPGRSSGSAE